MTVFPVRSRGGTCLHIDDKQITLQWLLWVAFSRWPIERCFEMRNWQGIHRHFYITQLSMLFCVEVQQSLREKNFGQFLPDGRTGSTSRGLLDYGAIYDAVCTPTLLSANCGNNNLLSTSQSTCQKIPSQANVGTPEKTRDKCREIKKLCAV